MNFKKYSAFVRSQFLKQKTSQPNNYPINVLNYVVTYFANHSFFPWFGPENAHSIWHLLLGVRSDRLGAPTQQKRQETWG